VGHLRVEAIEEADVLVVEEHVDEAAELPAVVVEALAEPRVRAVERAEHLADGAAVEAHLGRAAGEAAQLRRDANGDGHVRPPGSTRGTRRGRRRATAGSWR